MNQRTRYFLGFISGAAAGFLTGLLLAPDKGEKTRRRITERSSRVKDDVSDKLQESMKKANEVAETAFSLVNEYKEELKKESGNKEKNGSAKG